MQKQQHGLFMELFYLAMITYNLGLDHDFVFNLL